MSLFEELLASSDRSLVPDLYTYNTVMTVFSNSGMLSRALELLEEAKARGLRPDVVTYRRASACVSFLFRRSCGYLVVVGVRPGPLLSEDTSRRVEGRGRCIECAPSRVFRLDASFELFRDVVLLFVESLCVRFRVFWCCCIFNVTFLVLFGLFLFSLAHVRTAGLS